MKFKNPGIAALATLLALQLSGCGVGEANTEITAVETPTALPVEVVVPRNAEITAIESSSVHYRTDGESAAAECKQVIIAMGAQPDNDLETQLRTLALPGTLHTIGDCRHIGYIDGAILDAREIVKVITSR